MNAMRTIAATAVAFALLAGAADADAPPSVTETDDRIVLENADITVWFEDKRPALTVLRSGSQDEAFAFHFDRIVEFEDADGDGLASPSEVRAYLDVAGASDWSVSTASDATSAEVALTHVGPLHLHTADGVPGLEVPADRFTANVTLAFRLAAADAPAVGAPPAAAALAYEMRVGSWSWIDPEHQLALVVSVPADVVASGETAALVEQDGRAVGVLAWAPTALATTGDDEAQTEVLTSIESDDGAARIQHAFEAPGVDALSHDAWIGLAGALEGVVEAGGADGVRALPGPAGALVAVGAAVAALAARRP